MPLLRINWLNLLSGRAAGIPAQSSALVWLDGTLSGSEFVDKTGNGRNFTITNKDFTAEYFPYKSAATISAPTGDATLFAADVNSFLYGVDADSPNEIPVVSFFQNIDYEDIGFNRHVAQTVDGNGVETVEPHVKDIVWYAAALTGADLTSANSYYGVPTKETSNVLWVAKDGNDSDPGTEAQPKLTVGGGLAANTTVYVKSGTYVENNSGTFNLLLNQTNCNVIGIGRCTMQRGSTYKAIVYIFTAGASIEGFILDGESGAEMGALFKASGQYVKRCKTINNTDFSIDSTATATNALIQDCILTDELFRCYQVGGMIVQGNYQNAGRALRVDENPTEFIYRYNKVVLSSIVDNDVFKFASSGTITFFNNYMDFGALQGYFVSRAEDAWAPVLSFKYNTVTTTAALNTPWFSYGAGELDIQYNNLIASAATSLSSLSLIVAVGIPIKINNNFIDFQSASDSRVTSISSAGGVITPEIKYNRIIHKATAGYTILAGAEASGANDDDIHSTIEGNIIFGAWYFNPAASGNIHSIMVGFNQLAKVQYNFINGCGIGIVMKDTGGAFAGTCIGNVFKNCGYAGVLVKGVDGAKIYNNTFFNDDVDARMIRTENTTPNTVNLELKNNIFIDLNSPGDYIYGLALGDSVGLVSDYNQFYDLNRSSIYLYEEVAYTFAEWQVLGFDANSSLLTAGEFAALFTDADNDDYSLPIGSVAIGDGTTLAATYDDDLDASTNWGNTSTLPVVVTKQQTAPWDIGAYVS